jgi:hypothetical protein
MTWKIAPDGSHVRHDGWRVEVYTPKRPGAGLVTRPWIARTPAGVIILTHVGMGARALRWEQAREGCAWVDGHEAAPPEHAIARSHRLGDLHLAISNALAPFLAREAAADVAFVLGAIGDELASASAEPEPEPEPDDEGRGTGPDRYPSPAGAR